MGISGSCIKISTIEIVLVEIQAVDHGSWDLHSVLCFKFSTCSQPRDDDLQRSLFTPVHKPVLALNPSFYPM